LRAESFVKKSPLNLEELLKINLLYGRPLALRGLFLLLPPSSTDCLLNFRSKNIKVVIRVCATVLVAL
jgi:hypothetical protein